jgi:RNA polymerase sigma-70 factor (ECF subfamily)
LLLKRNYSSLEDEQLMQFVCKGEKKAFEELYARYSKKLWRYLLKLLNRDRDKADDFLQDIFMKVIESPEKFDHTKKFSTWIYTIATNLCRNELRNNMTRSRLIEESGMKEDYLVQVPYYSDLDHKQFRTELQTVYETLNEKDRIIFVLRFHHEMPVKEIAEILNCPEGTVKSSTYYLLKKIAQKVPHHNPNK